LLSDDECEEAKAELLAAQIAYDDAILSSRELDDGADVPKLHMSQFAEVFRRRQEAEKRVEEACGEQPGDGTP
jgi:hypothetical protein